MYIGRVAKNGSKINVCFLNIEVSKVCRFLGKKKMLENVLFLSQEENYKITVNV